MLKIINPATEDVIDELPSDTPRSVTAKYTRARNAQREWARTPLDRRLDSVRKFGRLLAD